MSAVLAQLLQMLGFLAVVALGLGVVFDCVGRGLRRDVAVGLVCGLAAVGMMLASADTGGGLGMDAQAPLLMIGALLGGPWGALAALPLPLATRLWLGGPAVLVGTASLVCALALGLAVHLASRRLGSGLSRAVVLALAALSPLTMVSLLAPGLAPEAGLYGPLIVPALVGLPCGTAAFGLVTAAELARSEAARKQREAERLQRSAGHVTREFFDRQLAHHAHLHLRFGMPSGYLLVSVDDGAAVRRVLRTRLWTRLHTELAQVIRASVRDSDVCTAADFDRFAVLLPHTDEAGMRVVAERIRDSVSEAFRVTPAGAVTVSIGMGSFTDGMDAEDVAAAAETALFLATAHARRNAIGPLPSPSPAAIAPFPAAAAADRPAPAPELAASSNVALFPVLISPEPEPPHRPDGRGHDDPAFML